MCSASVWVGSLFGHLTAGPLAWRVPLCYHATGLAKYAPEWFIHNENIVEQGRSDLRTSLHQWKGMP